MVVNGVKLLLDNFRLELSNYSVDIQDIVRSAILDDIDISEYLGSCKDSPFKLDQIRLGLKESLPEVYFKFSGQTIYSIRSLRRRDIDTSSVERQASNLSDTHMGYLLRWVERGYSVSDIDMAIVPESMLNVFEYGLQNGFDMLEFNNGQVYSERYIRSCLKIKKFGKPITVLLSGEFSIEVVELLGNICPSISKESRWNNLMDAISPSMSGTRVAALTEVAKYGVNPARVKDKEEQALGYLLSALKMGLKDIDSIINSDDLVYIESVIQSAKLQRGKTLHGRLRKN